MRVLLLALLINLVDGLSNDLWTMPWTAYTKFAASDTIVPNSKVDVQKFRGAALVATSDITNHKVYTSYTNTDSKVTKDFDNQAILSTPDNVAEGFGSDIALGWRQETGNMLFVGEVNIVAGSINNGAVHYYGGGLFSTWSVQQTLRPPSEFYEQSFFGAAIDLEDTEQRMLVVGCKGCNASFADGGALFLFEPTSPKASLWTQTAMLTTTRDLFTLGSSNVVINKGVIVADAMDGLSGAAVKNAIVFTREGPNRWTQQQELNIGAATTHSITDVTVFDETIIVGAGAATVNTITNAGQVNIFYPNTARFHLDPKGKPQPTQWSLQQVLLAPSVTQDFNFGDSVSMDGNRLAIADGGATSTQFYLYRREETHGRWSLQQTITSAPAGQIAGLKLLDNSVAVIEKTTTTLQIWDETTAWDCLIVSLEDHFNDGWDGMTLEIETPYGEKDVFTSRCDTANPFQFRYCPSGDEDNGIYKFRITGAKTAKFYWEMLWRVYEEADGNWHTGKWDTEMDFYWSKSAKAFDARKKERELPNNITCEMCTVRPTSAPTRSPTSAKLRQLHSKDNTMHPTISPAPTIAQSISLVPWQEVRLITAGVSAWFDAQHKGTSYYISDKHGHRLLSTGTMCPNERTLAYKMCWEDLPDGEYIFRVGGALDRFSTDHTFKFCSSENALKQESQMIFRVSGNGDHCEIISYATSATFCSNKLNLVQMASFTLDLYGTFSEDAALDTRAFGEAFASAYPAVNPSDVVVEAIQHTKNGLQVYVEVGVSSHASGFDFTDADSLDNYNQYMFADLGSREDAIMAALMSNTDFEHITKVYVSDAHNVETRETHVQTNMVFAEDLVDGQEEQIEVSTDIDWKYIITESSLVGVMLAVGMSAIIVYAVTAKFVYPVVTKTLRGMGDKLDTLAAATYGKSKKKRRFKNTTTRNTSSGGAGDVSASDSESDVESAVSPTKTSLAAAARSKQKVSIVGGSKTSEITLDDIKKLVDTEDRWLASSASNAQM